MTKGSFVNKGIGFNSVYKVKAGITALVLYKLESEGCPVMNGLFGYRKKLFLGLAFL